MRTTASCATPAVCRSAQPGCKRAVSGAYDAQQPRNKGSLPAAARWRTARSSSSSGNGSNAAHRPGSPCSASPAASSTASSDDDADPLVAAAAILRAAVHAGSSLTPPTPLDSLEEEARDLLILGAPSALDADALATAVGILRQRLDDDASACALSARLLSLMRLLDVRPAPSPGSSISSGTMSTLTAAPTRTPTSSPASGLESNAAGSDPSGGSAALAAAAAKGFWAEPDDSWADIRTALMAIGVDATVDEDDGGDELAAGGRGMSHGAVRLDAGTSEKLAAFLTDLQQQQQQQQQRAGWGGDRSGSGGVEGGAAAVVSAEQQQQNNKGAYGSGGGSKAEGGVSAEELAWWDAITAAYGSLWDEARAQQAAAGGGQREQ